MRDLRRVDCPRRAALPLVLALLLSLAFLPPASFAQTSVLTQHNNNRRDGANTGELVLGHSNVNTAQFGRLFKVSVDDQVFAQPLVANSVTIQGKTRSVVYVATVNNSIYALDAATGVVYWRVNLGTAFTVGEAPVICGDVLAAAGIMSTPVIDATQNTLYVVAKTDISGTIAHTLHALSLSTGAEQANSPVVIQAPGFASKFSLQRTGLLLANGNVYFSFSGHCDQGAYKGMTFAYQTGTLAQVGVHNASPSDNGAGIWQGGNGLAADTAGHVYWVTGNGTWDGALNFSESVLQADANLNLTDWHTPSNYSYWNTVDLDLTTSGAMLISGTNLLVTGGKDGILRVIDTANMGHLGDATAVQNFPANPTHIHSMSYFDSNLYQWGQNGYLKQIHFNGTKFDITPTFKGTTQALGHPGATLSISANGVSNGILWASTNTQGQGGGLGAWHMTEPGILYAISLPDMTELWNSEANTARDSCDNYAKFVAPTVANGVVYLASFGTAQTKSGQVCAYGLLAPATQPLIPDGTYILTSVNSGQALDVPAHSKVAGTALTQWPVNNGTNQQWVVANLGNNVISLTGVFSKQSVDIKGYSMADGAPIIQYPFHNVAWEKWKVTAVGDTSFELTSMHSSQALDAGGGSKNMGAPVVQNQYTGALWQQWIFTKKQ